MFTSAQSMNDELTERYRAAFESWPAVANLHHSISQPQLMRIPDSYVSSDVRLMIVGNETFSISRITLLAGLPEYPLRPRAGPNPLDVGYSKPL